MSENPTDTHGLQDQPDPPALAATHYCEKCDKWTDHRTYAHDLRVCSCGNRFDGDNLCMVSACQDET